MANVGKQPSAPGIKWRSRGSGRVAYWIPPTRDVSAGYPIRCVPLDPLFTEEQRNAKCREYWADLESWRRGQKTSGPKENTVPWLANRYRSDTISPFHAKRERTKRSYNYLCEMLTYEMDGVSLEEITGELMLEWYAEWVKESGPSAARHAITMLRTLAKYGIIIRARGAKDLVLLLCETLRFPVGAPRAIAPSRDEVKAIVDQAEKDGYLSIAITTQAQFDLIERRTHIIGYWERGAWRPGWEWPMEGWKIKYFQTKNGLVLREFDLRETPRLLELIQKIPEEERFGPVIKCERQRGNAVKRPWNERHYADVFREICRRVGVSDEIKSMDMRAGGATEADLIPEVTDRMLQDALGHSDPKTKDRYRRQKPRNAAAVVQLRQRNVVGAATGVPRSSDDK